MLVKNYGLFWKREHVFFGRPKVAGHLKGIAAKNRSWDPIDFREQQGVYALYDNAFRLVYVGQAGANDQQRLFDRLRQHTRDQLADRWTKFSWFGIRAVNNNGTLRVENLAAHPTTGDVLNHIEAVLISVAEPAHNRQGGRFGDEVEQFLQHHDVDQVGPDLHEMVFDMWRERQQE
jgi:hypothetical protein